MFSLRYTHNMYGDVPVDVLLAGYLYVYKNILPKLICITRPLARYAPLVLAPAGGWETVQTLLGAN